MNISADGTTLHINSHYLEQLFIVSDRFRDRVEGSARIHYNDGRSYNVHLYGDQAFRIVHSTDREPYCVWTTLKYNPSGNQGQVRLCRISSDTRHHRLITLPSAGVGRAAVLAEQEIPKHLFDEVLARVSSLESVEFVMH